MFRFHTTLYHLNRNYVTCNTYMNNFYWWAPLYPIRNDTFIVFCGNSIWVMQCIVGNSKHRRLYFVFTLSALRMTCFVPFSVWTNLRISMQQGREDSLTRCWSLRRWTTRAVHSPIGTRSGDVLLSRSRHSAALCFTLSMVSLKSKHNNSIPFNCLQMVLSDITMCSWKHFISRLLLCQ